MKSKVKYLRQAVSIGYLTETDEFFRSRYSVTRYRIVKKVSGEVFFQNTDSSKTENTKTFRMKASDQVYTRVLG